MGEEEFDEFDDDDRLEDDEDSWAEMTCGRHATGCSMVGTEYCDFECPFSAMMRAA